MLDVIVYLAMFLAGVVVGYILDRLSNGRAGRSGCSGSDSYATAAGRSKQLEDAITRTEQANANAVQTIEAIQNLIRRVRDSNDNNTSTMETE